ncbi:MAG: phage portal protein, partial [Candidatus Methanospirareceae archaeon]
MLQKLKKIIKLKSYTSDADPPQKPKFHSDFERWLLNLGETEPTNWDAYEELYLNYTDVQAHLDVITALTVGNGFNFVGDDKDAVEICESFAKQINLHQILENCVLTCLIFGNSYAVIVRDEDSLPSRENSFGIDLFIPHPKKIRILLNEYGEIERYWYDPTASFVKQKYLIDPQYVLHFKLKSYADKPYGLSLLHSAYDTLRLKSKIEQMAAVMAYRSSHGLLWVKVNLTEEDERIDPATGKTIAELKLEQVANALSNRVYESDTIRIVNNLVFDQNVELKNLAVQNDFSGVAKVLEQLQKQVDRALKVPRVFLGDPEGSNRATSFNQLLVFKLFIESIQRKFESEINKKLIPLITDADVRFKFNPPLKEDLSELVDQATKLYQYGVITEEEA